jgi:hypothetical protein
MADNLSELVGKLEALQRHGTPGPWYRDATYFVGLVPHGRPGGEIIGSAHPTVNGLLKKEQQVENAELLIAAVNAIPALVALLAEGKQMVGEWKACEQHAGCKGEASVYPLLADELEHWLGITKPGS